jgi:two-component system response regulator LytT
MQTHPQKSDLTFNDYPLKAIKPNKINNMLPSWSTEDIVAVFEKTNVFKNFFQQNRQANIGDLLTKLASPPGKKSFLVFKHHKYITVPTENIAFFYVKYEASIIVCFDRQEYTVNYSLEQIQNLVTDKQFFRLNRQYLINFNAVKEAEHYFARKLLVNLVVAAKEKLLVSKEKVSSFLHWLENR